ncbi:putative collagen-binding domain-containing protein [Negadavirga shengliensis]|uniref:Collagen-binding domain-containing protein n=1 Tax=Negadavirga shengliensis TaxID=1389218 RepID=A0ABV9SWX1_9BACT
MEQGNTRLSKCLLYPFILLIGFAGFSCNPAHQQEELVDVFIKPWADNPYYWEYKSQPVLLLGATDNDNLFQNKNLKSHLDSLQAIGGNYVRNTMSDRDTGDLRAFAQNEAGKYDLDKWNERYWESFENLLKWAEERDIIVQIEIWDRFDHSRDEWITDPYNPKNNINYTYDEARLDSIYPDHPGSNKQPFFFTVPDLDNNEVLLAYQQAFVRKLLSISLKYGNVLYCIDNETSGMEEWAVYWAGFVKEIAAEERIYITEMWDDWDVTSRMHKRTLDHPGRYDFIDIAQNSHKTGQENWDNAQYVFDYIKKNPRPVNSTKIYGSDAHEAWLFRGMTTKHAFDTFFRNILGGFASSRFHRPPHGLGMSELSINAIKTIRKVEEKVKMWEVEPQMELLTDLSPNEAYVAAKAGEKYIVFFPQEGEVSLNMAEASGNFELSWIDATTGEWLAVEEIAAGEISLSPPVDHGSIGVMVKK